MAREIVGQRKREDYFEKCLPPETVPKQRGRRFRKEGRVNRRDLIETVQVGRGLESRTESLFRGWTVYDGPRGAWRMIVSYRDAGIGMVAFEMMIGMIVMTQTAFQCLSCSGINKEKRKQDNGDFSHRINLGPLLFQEAVRGYRLSALTNQFFSFSSSSSRVSRLLHRHVLVRCGHFRFSVCATIGPK